MKWGKELLSKQNPRFRGHYIAYDDLKAILKRCKQKDDGAAKSPPERGLAAATSAAFIAALQKVSICMPGLAVCAPVVRGRWPQAVEQSRVPPPRSALAYIRHRVQEIVRIDSFVTAVQAQLDAERQRVDGAFAHGPAALRAWAGVVLVR